jgi:hypothetical protein
MKSLVAAAVLVAMSGCAVQEVDPSQFLDGKDAALALIGRARHQQEVLDRHHDRQ